MSAAGLIWQEPGASSWPPTWVRGQGLWCSVVLSKVINKELIGNEASGTLTGAHVGGQPHRWRLTLNDPLIYLPFVVSFSLKYLSSFVKVIEFGPTYCMQRGHRSQYCLMRFSNVNAPVKLLLTPSPGTCSYFSGITIFAKIILLLI